MTEEEFEKLTKELYHSPYDDISLFYYENGYISLKEMFEKFELDKKQKDILISYTFP